MVHETGILVAGTGYSGSALAREFAAAKAGSAPFVILDKDHGEMLLDVILSEKGDELAGALVLREGAIVPMRAPAVVLATGSAAGLFPGGDWRHSGDALAIAHRAGLTFTQPVLVDGTGHAEMRAGVPCQRDGSTALRGLFVAGSAGSDRPDLARLAKAATLRSREPPSPFGPYRHHPTVDSPLPAGFADVKFSRLQQVMGGAVTGDVPRDRALVELHRLKGEADEFSRARIDPQLFSLQNACEVAILLLKMA